MQAKLRGPLLLAALVAAAVPARAEAQPAACPALPAGDVLADRAGMLQQFERLPHACLKHIVRQCGEAADRTLLDLGDAASCSIGYEALLRQGFGGDFQALVAWWQAGRRAAL